jgi:hypothetical protein
MVAQVSTSVGCRGARSRGCSPPWTSFQGCPYWLAHSWPESQAPGPEYVPEPTRLPAITVCWSPRDLAQIQPGADQQSLITVSRA